LNIENKTIELVTGVKITTAEPKMYPKEGVALNALPDFSGKSFDCKTLIPKNNFSEPLSQSTPDSLLDDLGIEMYESTDILVLN
jgi:hypothetical protein